MGNSMTVNAKSWATSVGNLWTIVVHILDILIVAYFIYRLIKTLTGTKIMSLIQGVVFFILLKFAAEWTGFATITYLMNQVIIYDVVAGVVIFAPEIRSGLEKFGRSTQVFLQIQQASDEEKLIEALVKPVAYMNPREIGALILIERTQALQEYIPIGIPLDVDISGQLLINTFIPNTSLHNGAVTIRGNKIAMTCFYLPLSESVAISKEFGIRHRIMIGLSENSDILTIVVPKETGSISIAPKGEFLYDLTKESFEAILRTQLITEVGEEEHWYHKI